MLELLCYDSAAPVHLVILHLYSSGLTMLSGRCAAGAKGEAR
jgi:hypothetical protein